MGHTQRSKAKGKHRSHLHGTGGSKRYRDRLKDRLAKDAARLMRKYGVKDA